MFVAMCVGCYSIAKGNGDLDMYNGNLPPISALGGHFPEQGLFIFGFSLQAVLLLVCIFYRSAMIDQVEPGSKVNNVLFVLALIGLPNLIVMASVSMYTPLPAGVFHLGCAAVGMVLLASYNFWTTIFCLWLSFRSSNRCVDSHVSLKVVRIALYLFTCALSLLGPILFAVWMSDVSVTIFEWVAVSLVFSSMFPNLVFFGVRRPTQNEYSQIQ
jgi:hypothetical protein